MAGQLVSLDRGPSDLVRGRRSNLNSAAKQGVQPSFAVLGYKGKVWRLKYRQEETVLRDDRQQPLSAIDVVIVGVASAISRQYFDRAFVEGDSEGPVCFSTDGVKPDNGSPKKQHPTCQGCPQAMWGSRITEAGKKAMNCQTTRRLAVVPLTDLENKIFGGPMLLRIPPMSINNLSSYSDFLDRKGAGFETVATRIGFDPEAAYPRLTFNALGFLDDDQQEVITGPDGNSGVCADPMIERLLGASASDAPSDPVGPPQPAPQPAPEPEPEEEDEEEAPPPPRAARAAPFAPPPPRNGRAAIPNDADMESALDNLLGDNAA